jgi:hypothetical protein
MQADVSKANFGHTNLKSKYFAIYLSKKDMNMQISLIF